MKPFSTLISSIVLDEASLSEIIKDYCAAQGYELVAMGPLPDTSLRELKVRPLSGAALEEYEATTAQAQDEIGRGIKLILEKLEAIEMSPATPIYPEEAPTAASSHLLTPLVKDSTPARFTRPISKHLATALSNEPRVGATLTYTEVKDVNTYVPGEDNDLAP